MASEPSPLAAGVMLADRFTVIRVLGRGGFGIAYLARDEARGDQVVVKELAPIGVKRNREQFLDLDQSGTSGHILRHRFLQETEILRKLRHPGIPDLRASFAENGTAYFVSTYLPHSRTLEEKIRRDGPVLEDEAREIFTSLLDVLEVVHGSGLLHRDIKPSNILLGPNGQIVLLDFGAARDWVAGGAITHTVMHTPGYAPPEQLSERAPRGAATDLYSLCATIYHALAGKAPTTAPERSAGLPLTPISHLRPDIDPGLALAVQQGLALKLADRPRDVAEMRTRLLEAPGEDIQRDLRRLDDTLFRLRRFRFDRRACPSCEGVLHEPKPLRRLGCPVCREGHIRPRNLDDRLCPACQVGLLDTIDNSDPLGVCPRCGKGVLVWRKKGLLSPVRISRCPECSKQYEFENDRLSTEGESHTCDEWRLQSGRGRTVRRCPECFAAFDELPDGRWRQTFAGHNTATPLYWDEWIRLAAGLDPGAGNAACDACRADYWWEGESITLLDYERDPYKFAAKYTGRPVSVADARWLGVGKSSGEPGPLCESCGTEFDREGDCLRLVTSPSRRLSARTDETLRVEDWHRLANDLPTTTEEGEVEAALNPLLIEAYVNGEIAFDENGALWRGKAVRISDESEGILFVSRAELSFGGRLRRQRIDLGEIREVQATEDVLILYLTGETEAEEYRIVPICLTAHLKSGDHSIELNAEDLAERLDRVGSEKSA